MYLNNLDIYFSWLFSCVQSGHSLEGSAPFLRVFFFFNITNVLKRVPKWSVNLLIVLSTFYERGILSCWRTCRCLRTIWFMSFTSGLLRGSALLSPASDHLAARLAVLFLGVLLVLKSPVMTGVLYFWRDCIYPSHGIFYLQYLYRDGEGLNRQLDFT